MCARQISSHHALNTSYRNSIQLLIDYLTMTSLRQTSCASESSIDHCRCRPAFKARGSQRAPLLAVIASHNIVTYDLQLAFDLSDLLRDAISLGTSKTYKCGFDSLSKFCKERKFCALPVDAVTVQLDDA